MSVTHHYCTLFDKNYLYKGIAMYSSLQRVSDSFHLWVLAMDSETYTHLKKRGLPNVTVLSLNEVEDEELSIVGHLLQFYHCLLLRNITYHRYRMLMLICFFSLHPT